MTQTATQGRLTIEVDGLRNDAGHVLVALYDDPEAFPRDNDAACRTGKIEIREQRASLTFDDLPAGTYAVALLHDENDDGKMNANRFGIPTEGIGLSNLASFKLRPPRFDDSAFSFAGGDEIVRVKVHYLL